MVWSPSASPKQTIDDYYPGDNYVDWVGLSMYSVKFFNGDKKQPADYVNPLDLLDYVYEQYADRKPIMISEYAATHFSKAGNEDTTQFAITKMNMLYNGIKLKYPRVKAVHWFSLNTLEDSHSEARKLNNFSLTENMKIREAYRKMVSDPYFLSSVQTDNTNSKLAYRIYEYKNQVIRDNVTATFWAKTYDPKIQKVVVSLDGKQIPDLKQYPFEVSLNTSKLTTGSHQLKAVVYDSKNRVAISKTFVIKTGK
ncbi:Ig-like domain-containing protein [Paenibacillus macquariensis]|uniref:GH26 domain-containing protein n=1 Tax=Paenibacillus macquariensis TaxID=948756 RepID=A0ABY1JNK4_9BACL|nr:Ig-like domain-containing protein [Paenibacillus macquariensis]MEC0092153.1 Ig-like domain-containing protein [Paenibacillus macquariensis]OAB37294.1 hypothetical protein PMSM_04260 [Paenibacillus macquariensis subsp. macquariensis]SIQ50086.1 hypothetical protein SAMN05421578_102276 [Paenibacillus macquariensis]